jgi:cob(I)alamin adenosyltransferase
VSTDPDLLKTTLDRLHRELAQIQEVDPELREQLAAALAEIQTALHDKAGSKEMPAGSTMKAESLVKRLREAARRFEANHPELADNIGGLIDTLGQSGI